MSWRSVKYLLVFLFIGFNFVLIGQDTPTNIPQDEVQIAVDDPIVEQLIQLELEQNRYYDKFTTDTVRLIEEAQNYTHDEGKTVTDSLLKARLKVLDDASPFSLVFNGISKSYIKVYVKQRRQLTSSLLARSQYYFPIFEEKLAKYDLPQELKYLAIVESALRPAAKSWAGACGLWQFMYHTGKRYGLKVTSFTDDRKDVIKATDAACRHFVDLYKIYHNWELVIAAYNCGPGNVNKAIRKAGGKRNYWKIYNYLPKETRGYVPAFIAVNYAMNYATHHGIFPQNPKVRFYELDTLFTKERVNFNVAARYLNTSEDFLTYLNPRYVHGIIPASTKGNYFYLPKDKVGAFIANESKISTGKKKAVASSESSSSSSSEKIIYRVKTGDHLGGIAKKYSCRVSDIKRWNKLKSNYLKKGQRLAIYKKQRKSTMLASTNKPTKVRGYRFYRVETGDDLEKIASKHQVSVEDLIGHNKGLSKQSLKVGTTLKIIIKE